MESPWLFPTQNVGGVVVLSTKTRRMFVDLGKRYSTNVPVRVSSRATRSVVIDPVHACSSLSSITSYGAENGVGTFHSLITPDCVSSMPMLCPRYSPNHSRSRESIVPRRGEDPFVGVS